MSRAFVREPDGEQAGDDQPELPQSRHPNYVTPRGLAALERRLAELKDQQGRPGSGEALADRLHEAQLAREVRYLEGRLERAIRVDPAAQPRDEVAFGALVTVVEESGAERRYAIVGEDEADPERGLVSWVSPLARALTGAGVGDLVTWRRPAGDVELEVVAIAYPES